MQLITMSEVKTRFREIVGSNVAKSARMIADNRYTINDNYLFLMLEIALNTFPVRS